MRYTSTLTNTKGTATTDSSPFPVAHIFLPDANHQKMKAALEPHVTSRTSNAHTLRSIFRDKTIFPSDFLRDLEALRDDPDNRTVFVLHNLPEINPSTLCHTDIKDKYALEGRLQMDSYAPYISKGMSAAIGLRGADAVNSIFALARFSGASDIEGAALHKHSEDATTLSGILSSGEKTRFTDWQAVLEEVQQNPELQNIPIFINDDKMRNPVPLAQFSTLHKDWRRKNEMHIVPSPEHQQAFDALINRHSQDLVIGTGDMALWSNNGPIMHQALPGEHHDGPVRLTRAVVGHSAARD